jgi:hypothetical protein
MTNTAGVEPTLRSRQPAGAEACERGACHPTVSLRPLLNGESHEIGGACDVDTPTYTDEILRSGFTGIRNPPKRGRHLQLVARRYRVWPESDCTTPASD